MTWLRVDHVATAMRAATEKCRSCRHQIVWAQTVNGKAMPLDVEPSERGNVAVDLVFGVLHAGVVSGPDRDSLRAAKRPLYLSHFTTCPHADNWRNNR
ncbi:hypothetical protein [Rhodococcus zopfii]|uniref:hypothetical protein n=1 Tax=Rhodococcus zopfii TaxID=43772 RepID=UPI003529673C